MKTYKKVIQRYDARTKDYNATVARLRDPKKSAAYRKPGSRKLK